MERKYSDTRGPRLVSVEKAKRQSSRPVEKRLGEETGDILKKCYLRRHRRTNDTLNLGKDTAIRLLELPADAFALLQAHTALHAARCQLREQNEKGKEWFWTD